jgi:hypothetical protein
MWFNHPPKLILGNSDSWFFRLNKKYGSSDPLSPREQPLGRAITKADLSSPRNFLLTPKTNQPKVTVIEPRSQVHIPLHQASAKNLPHLSKELPSRPRKCDPFFRHALPDHMVFS